MTDKTWRSAFRNVVLWNYQLLFPTKGGFANETCLLQNSAKSVRNYRICKSMTSFLCENSASAGKSAHSATWKKRVLLLAWIINALCYWKHHYKDIKPLFLCLLLSIRWGKQEPKRSVGPCNKSFTPFSKQHFHLSHIATYNNG